MPSPCELRGDVSHAIEAYTQSVVRTAFAYTKNRADAEDIAQEVFLALWTSSPAFDSEDHVKAWLLRVTINRCKNHLKSAWRRKRAELTDDLPDLSAEDNEVLWAVLSLDAKYRLPLHLFYYEGYAIREIAAILNEKPATIGSRLDRGRGQLKRILGGVQDDSLSTSHA